MSEIVSEILWWVFIDCIFAAVFVLCLLPLALFRKASYAVLKRNFVGYFMNPTGYVFLMMFVIMTSVAAFWPHEFFAANLASLHQLNGYLPWILLIFIPAITMSMWSEERRQGTDELLLTLPADDFDVVFGKYLSSVAIYTCSLACAQVVHYFVLILLSYGEVDTGMLCTTYFGYWLAGIAMIAIGMVASFLTRNLTVGFILGVVFNSPLVFLEFVDVLADNSRFAHTVSTWSIASRIDDFGRGVISLSSVAYFVLLAVLGLYLSMVLIGSRHWWGGRDGTSLIGHYFVRTVMLITIAAAGTYVFYHHDRRIDMTEGRVSSLSPDTLRLLRNLDKNRPVRIHAYFSAQIPEQYIQTEIHLKSLLKEFESRSKYIDVSFHDNLEIYSEEAVSAEQRYGITPQKIQTRSGGTIKDQDLIMGAAFESGLEKVIVPFFEYGIPVEYELIRSISTVNKGEKPKLGVVRNDAPLFATPTFVNGEFQTVPQMQIIDELQKTYDIEQLDPESPITTDSLSAMVVVQPSAMSPEGLENVVAAIKSGIPTAIFEDPVPQFVRVPGTGDPRQGGPMGMMQGGPQPKADVNKLWDLLGLDIPIDPGQFGSGVQPKLAWQVFNPYPRFQLETIQDEFIFASVDAPGGKGSFNSKSPITDGLREVLFPFCGVVQQRPSSELEFTPLVSTGVKAGRIALNTLRENQRDSKAVKLLQGPATGEQVLAAAITGDVADADVLLDEESDKETNAEKDAKKETDKSSSTKRKEGVLNVVYVADVDVLSNPFLFIRARPSEDQEDVQFHFENITFVLNIVDHLAGLKDFVSVRKHKPVYYTLKRIEERIEEARNRESQERDRFSEGYEAKKAEEQKKLNEAGKALQDRLDALMKKQEAGEPVDLNEVRDAAERVQAQKELANRRMAQRTKELLRERDRQIQKIRMDTENEAMRIRLNFRVGILPVPVVLILFMGVMVYGYRRLREREGISRGRLVR